MREKWSTDSRIPPCNDSQEAADGYGNFRVKFPTVQDEEQARLLVEASEKLRAQLGRIIVGQADVLEHLLIAVLARGHCLLEGVPGLAKTLIVRSLADAVNLSFRRIQFTPT